MTEPRPARFAEPCIICGRPMPPLTFTDRLVQWAIKRPPFHDPDKDPLCRLPGSTAEDEAAVSR